MTQQFKIGDLVEFTNGEEVRRGRLTGLAKTNIWWSFHSTTIYAKDGWSGTLIEAAKPAVVLPTEPGWYLDKDDDAWELLPESPDNELRWRYNNQYKDDSIAALLAPFTRLAPVAETAQKIIDRIDDMCARGAAKTLSDVQQIIRNEFVGDK
jgi:hypothetical protein